MKKAYLRFLLCLIILDSFLLTGNFLFSKENETHSKALTGVRIIGAKNPQPIEDGTILIEGNIITAVGRRSEVKIPEGTQIIDLKGKTAMPGLIDLHVHATWNRDLRYDQKDSDPDAVIALRAAKFLGRLLGFGVTTVRDVGGIREIPGSLKKAQALKLITGPRYYQAGRIITNTGGHGWDEAQMVDGKEEIIKAIRGRFYEGLAKCDFIKVTWNLPEGYSTEEIRTAIEETHKYGKKIAVHAYQPETIQACVEYGADTIEHAWGIDLKTIPMAVQKKTIVVPTVYIMAQPLYDAKFKYKGENYDEFIKGTKSWVDMILGHLKPYVASGGVIAMGTDSGYPVPDNMPGEELIIYKELGMTPFQIIQAGTINGARAIGIEDKAGTIEKGKWADILVLDGNPLDDIQALKKVRMVILDGDVVVNN
jgi:imidazolonepropionase-like amidohydrolase